MQLLLCKLIHDLLPAQFAFYRGQEALSWSSLPSVEYTCPSRPAFSDLRLLARSGDFRHSNRITGFACQRAPFTPYTLAQLVVDLASCAGNYAGGSRQLLHTMVSNCLISLFVTASLLTR